MLVYLVENNIISNIFFISEEHLDSKTYEKTLFKIFLRLHKFLPLKPIKNIKLFGIYLQIC